jgi:hypothetical protein
MANDLWEAVAEHLSGHKVSVSRGPTPVEGMSGTTTREGEAYKIILVSWMDPDECLRIFLHEVAHVKLEHPGDLNKLDPETKELMTTPGALHFTPELYDDYQVDPDEKAAWELAAKWLEYAKRWAYFYRGHTALIMKLNCLLEYPAKEIQYGK